MHTKRLVSGIFFSAAIVVGVGILVYGRFVSAEVPAPATSQVDGALLPIPMDDGATLLASEFRSEIEAVPADLGGPQDGTQPSNPEKVPEPATVVSLAGLAAMAGIALLLRVRWFRRA